MGLYVLSLFIAFFLYWEVNFPFRFKILFKISITRNIKIIDCFPCFTFWITLIVTVINQNVELWYIPLAGFLTAKVYEKSIEY